MRYLDHRGLKDTGGRTVWDVFGHGEMDEPESVSMLTPAAREKLASLVWIMKCNLQRLDGPVRGNGRIIAELEALFACAGWNVIKLVWGSDWGALFTWDYDGALVEALSATVDNQFQTFAAKDGLFNREHFFGLNEALAKLAAGLTDETVIVLNAAVTTWLKSSPRIRAPRLRARSLRLFSHRPKGLRHGGGRSG